MTVPRRIDELDHGELATLVREYLLAGHLIDRAGMPHAIAAFGREVMGEIAIDEWSGASPVYTRRIQRLLGFDGRDDVETIFKGMQFDIGAPPQFMDFRYRVDDAAHGEFWLDHCGALMDVEPMGDEFVHTMCHTIEDPTFDATACATNPRARMTPIHRPPREPAERHPHCHWNVDIVADAPAVPEPEPAVRLAATRLAALPVPIVDAQAPDSRESGESGDGWLDYAGRLDPDLRMEQFSRRVLVPLAAEVALQGHLLAMSFIRAVEQRSSTEQAVEIGAHQFAGIAGLTAGRLRDAFGLGTDLAAVAQVLELHPAFHPRDYLDWRVELLVDGAGEEQLTVHLGRCDALDETGLDSWATILAAGDASALDAVVRAVDPRASCVPVAPVGADVATWRVEIGDQPHPESSDVELARFSTGADLDFVEVPVSLG